MSSRSWFWKRRRDEPAPELREALERAQREKQKRAAVVVVAKPPMAEQKPKPRIKAKFSRS